MDLKAGLEQEDAEAEGHAEDDVAGEEVEDVSKLEVSH
jgi:hypothetical protein